MLPIVPERFSNVAINLPLAVAFASGVCASILAVLLLVYSFNREPAKTTAAAPPPEKAAPAAEKQVAEQPAAPEPSRVLGAQREDVSCENQTWPYIDQRCLTPAAPRERVVTKPPSESGTLSPNSDVRLDPSAQENKAASQTTGAASTDGVASPSDRASAPIINPAPMTTLPDRPTAITGVPPMTPQSTVADVVPATPAQTTAVPAAAPESIAPRRKTKDIRSSRERIAGTKTGDPDRIVKRWREVEYEDADGGRRRVIYPQQGAPQRDSYFEIAR